MRERREEGWRVQSLAQSYIARAEWIKTSGESESHRRSQNRDSNAARTRMGSPE